MPLRLINFAQVYRSDPHRFTLIPYLAKAEVLDDVRLFSPPLNGDTGPVSQSVGNPTRKSAAHDQVIRTINAESYGGKPESRSDRCPLGCPPLGRRLGGDRLCLSFGWIFVERYVTLHMLRISPHRDWIDG